MLINAKYILSAPSIDKLPRSEIPEIAFFGRSNVGKSSLLNLLANHKKLARVSKTPGRTRALNLFEAQLDKQDLWILDLPGYGYAKLSHTERDSLSKMLHEYLEKREQLITIIHLLDCRRDPNEEDIKLSYDFRKYVPNYILGLTKTDKIVLSKRKMVKKRFMENLSTTSEQTILLSTLNRAGHADLLKQISHHLRNLETKAADPSENENENEN